MVLDTLRTRWPRDDLEYLRLIATTLLALVVLPLAIVRLLTHPAEVAERAIGGHLR